jgi:hypothetical protein
MLEPDDLARGVFGHRLDRVLVAEVVRALDAVEGVVLRGIVLTIAERGVDAALRRSGMAPDRVHLRYDRHVGSALGGFDGRTHSSEPASDDHDIVFDQALRPSTVMKLLFIV